MDEPRPAASQSSSAPPPPPPLPARGLGRRSVQKVLLAGLVLACLGYVAFDLVLFLTHHDKHPYFGWEQRPAFSGVAGFVSVTLLVLLGRSLRPLVKRGESFYE